VTSRDRSEHLNLNTVLITVVLGISAWALVKIGDLSDAVAEARGDIKVAHAEVKAVDQRVEDHIRSDPKQKSTSTSSFPRQLSAVTMGSIGQTNRE
jgi:hypothetical protein